MPTKQLYMDSRKMCVRQKGQTKKQNEFEVSGLFNISQSQRKQPNSDIFNVQ